MRRTVSSLSDVDAHRTESPDAADAGKTEPIVFRFCLSAASAALSAS